MRILIATLAVMASLSAKAAGRSGCRGDGCSEPVAVERAERDCIAIWDEIVALRAQIDALPARHPMRVILGWRLSRLMAEYAAAGCNEPC